MGEVIVIFSLAATGCLVALSTDLALQFFARRLPSSPMVTGPQNGQPHESQPKADPLVTLVSTLSCYGAIALALVAELPGDLPFQRTWLAFALLCVGGLIGEISRANNATLRVDHEEEVEPEHTPTSVGLSVALMLALNLAVAVLAAGQGLLPIVPPQTPASAAQAAELEQIVVVARRDSNDPISAASFL